MSETVLQSLTRGDVRFVIAIGVVVVLVAIGVGVGLSLGASDHPEAKYVVVCSSGGQPVLVAYTNDLPTKQPDGSWIVNDLDLPPDKPVVVSGATSCVTRPQN